MRRLAAGRVTPVTAGGPGAAPAARPRASTSTSAKSTRRALEVDAHDLDLDAVPQPVRPLRVLPLQEVRPLLEAVVVVRHRRDVHQPLHVDRVELHEQAEGLHARDVARVAPRPAGPP